MNNWPLYLALAFILVHEMDAIRCHEWRIFPGTSALPDKAGYLVFTALHIPLFYFLLSLIFTDQGIEPMARILLDSFLIVHVFLHLLLRNHPKNEFHSLFSWLIIYGAGFFGTVDLLIYLNTGEAEQGAAANP